MNTQTTPQMPQVPGTAPTPQASGAQQTQTAPIPGAQQQTQNNYPKNDLHIVGRTNYTGKHLFEVTGFVDKSKNFPSSNAFLMVVPGIPDKSKMTGITYDQNQRETMKVLIRDFFALSEALRYAALYKKNPGFTIFTDSSKYAGHQGAGVTKSISVSVAQNSRDASKYTIFLTYSGQKKTTVVMDSWHALGLADQILNLANETEKAKFQIEKKAIEDSHKNK